jgi:hypothetical protein
MTFNILVAIFNGCNTQDYKQGEDNQTRRDGVKFTKELQDRDPEEEATCERRSSLGKAGKERGQHAHIGYPSKLLKQISWQECDDRVFGGNYLI